MIELLVSHHCEDLKSNNTAFDKRKKGKKEEKKRGRKNCIRLPQYGGSPPYSCMRFYLYVEEYL